MLACPALNTFSLPPQDRLLEFNEIHVDCLRPCIRRPVPACCSLGGETCPPALRPRAIIFAAGAPEHEVAEPLNFKMRYGWPHILVRWTGCDPLGDTWEPLENLTNCEEAIAAFERATCSTLLRPAQHPPPAAGPVPPYLPRQGSPSPGPRRTSARRSSADSCSTGDRTMAGSAAPSPVFAHVPRSRTWWPTPGRRRRCAAWRTCCSNAPPMTPAGCF